MAHELTVALAAADICYVVRKLLGEPSSVSRHEIRFRRRGSLAIVHEGPKRGSWFDHETGEGGDLLMLIMREHDVDFRRAIEIARELLGSGRPIDRRRPTAWRSDPDAAVLNRKAYALNRWALRKSCQGSPAECYLQNRGINISALDLDHVLGWDPEARAMLALMTDPVTAEPSGIHRTFLDVDDRKLDRKMLGKQGVIRISPDEEVGEGLGICEGVEDALSVLLSGWRPIWAATCAGAIARFPVLNGIQALTVFADGDDAGLTAARSCVDRWREAGREAVLWVPGVAHG